jgi:hypothetical protein
MNPRKPSRAVRQDGAMAEAPLAVRAQEVGRSLTGIPQPVPCGGRVPVAVQVRADADVIVRGEPLVQRDLLGEEADLGQEGRVLTGCAAQYFHLARIWPGQPGQQAQQRGLVELWIMTYLSGKIGI